MAKSELKLIARKMRAKGESVKEIARKLGVAKSTVSLWVRDIILSVEQIENLRQRSIRGLERAALMGALIQKERRLNLIKEFKKRGASTIGKLNDREFLIAGLALYWAEGSKTKRSVRVCNSDPRLICIMIEWFRKTLGARMQDMKAAVGINEIHREREEIVKKFWSDITGIPLVQFRKTSFKKAKNHKVYENFNDHYGTLMVEVLKSARFYYKIMGLIEAMARQGSSTVERIHHKDTAVGSNPTPATNLT